jgi:NhaA family Na+:H+ antiporter
MAVPAIFFTLVNFRNPDYMNGWGIPMATDIAFSLGILSMLGKRVNINIKIFLTALAIADDLGAILVIAIFYTETIHLSQLLNAGIFLLILLAANRLGVRRTTFYALVGLGGVWLSFIFSGVHATIAGVLIALTIPGRPRIAENDFICKLENLINKFRKEESNNSGLLTNRQSHLISEIEKVSDDAHTPLQKLEHALHPVVAWFILPVFALSNAGVRIEGNILDMLLHPLSLGIIFGLVAGKFIGISLFTRLSVRTGLASLPEGVRWRDIYGAAMLAGIGFTMSMFISDLAFDDQGFIAIAKVGIFTASIISALIGVTIFVTAPGNAKK